MVPFELIIRDIKLLYMTDLAPFRGFGGRKQEGLQLASLTVIRFGRLNKEKALQRRGLKGLFHDPF